jgi:hypothetical protein
MDCYDILEIRGHELMSTRGGTDVPSTGATEALPAAAGPAATQTPPAVSATHPGIGRLMEEYKILQDKIDKIGGFRFTVKGWSVTLITGSLAAASAANNPGYVPLALILVVVTFFLLEYEQWELSLRFGMRATEIEEALDRVRKDPTYALADFDIPGLARDLMRKRRKIPIHKQAWSRLRRSYKVEWLIYWVQVILVVIVTFWLYHKPPSGP